MPAWVAGSRFKPDGRRALALAALAFTLFNANLRLVVEGDSRPARLLPFALWHAGSLTLDSLPELAQAVEKNPHYDKPYWLWRSGGHLLSTFPVVTPILVAPLYAPAAAVLWLRGWDPGRIAAWAPRLEKLSASSLCALAVGLFYLLLLRRPAGGDPLEAPASAAATPGPRRQAREHLPPAAADDCPPARLGRRDATLLAVALAFGTGTWPISSQALWAHGAGELLGVLALLAISGLGSSEGAGGRGSLPGRLRPRPAQRPVAVSPLGAGRLAAGSTSAASATATVGQTAASRRWLLLLLGAGAACGLMAANRPPDGILAAALLGYLALSWRWRSLVAVAAAAAAAAPFAWYNEHYFGLLAGGYGAIGLAGPHPFYQHPMLLGALGLLVSPAKGLLLFSPFLLFLPAALRRARPPAAAASCARGRTALPPEQALPPPTDRRLVACVLAGCLAQLLFYGLTDWRGGACYGPRFLADAMPLWVWLLAPALPRLQIRGRRWFIAALLAAISIQAIGAFCYPMGGSDEIYFPSGHKGAAHLRIGPEVWQPRNAAFLLEARGGLAPPSLLPGRWRAHRIE